MLGRVARRTTARSPSYYVTLFACLGFVSIVDRTVFALLIEPMKKDLAISDVEAGLLIGPAFALLYTVSALPVALAIDKGNRKWIMVIGVSIWSASTLASAFAPTFEWLLVLRMGVAIGEAVLNPVAVSMIGDLFPQDRRSLPAGIYHTSQMAGGAGSFILVSAILSVWTPNIVPVAAGVTAWRVAVFIVGMPGLFLALLMAVTVAEPARGGASSEAAVNEGKAEPFFVSRGESVLFYLPFLLSINITIGLLNGCTTWFPTWAFRTFGVPLPVVGYLFATAMLASLVGTMTLPVLSHFFLRRGRVDWLLRLIFCAMPITAFFYIVALTAHELVEAMVLIAIFIGVVSGISPMVSILISTLGSPNVRGRLVAIHLIFQSLFAYLIGPVAIPFLAEHLYNERLGPAMQTLAAISVPLSLIILLAAWRPFSRATKRYRVVRLSIATPEIMEGVLS